MTNNQLLYFNRTKLPQKETKQNKIKTHWNASWFCSFTVKKSFFNRQTVRFPLTAKQPAKLVFLVSFLRKVKSKGSYYRLTQTYRSAIESSRFTQVSILFSSGYIFAYFCSHHCWQIYTQSLMQHLSGDKIFTVTMKLTVFCIRFHYEVDYISLRLSSHKFFLQIHTLLQNCTLSLQQQTISLFKISLKSS